MNDKPITAYFFGVRPGEKSGHYCWTPGCHAMISTGSDWPITPWGSYPSRMIVGELNGLRAAFDPDGDDPRLLEDGSRWVDTMALMLVCEHMAQPQPGEQE